MLNKINKALLKYGYSGFKLDILEYCTKDDVIGREQYYLDLLNPEYNILKKAGSTLGFRHSDETIAKFRETRKNRVFSEETRGKLTENNLNRSVEYKEKLRARLLELNLAKGHEVEVTNILTNEKTIYPTIRQASKEIGVAHVSVRRVIESKKILKATYKISYTNNQQ